MMYDAYEKAEMLKEALDALRRAQESLNGVYGVISADIDDVIDSVNDEIADLDPALHAEYTEQMEEQTRNYYRDI